MAVGSLDPARLHAVAINRQPSHPPLCVWCVPCTVIVCTVIVVCGHSLHIMTSDTHDLRYVWLRYRSDYSLSSVSGTHLLGTTTA